MYKQREDLTREFILSKISEEDIFHKYMGVYPNTTDYFTNPFRQDTFPDCKFYVDHRGTLKFNDFAYKWNVDCFNVVERLYNCNYGEALHIIAKDFDIYNDDIDFKPIQIHEVFHKETQSIGREIGVQRKDFTKWDMDFWTSQGWTKESLSFFKVGSLLRAWIDKKQIYTYNKKDPGFEFYFGMSKHFLPLYKLYFPLRDRYRFLQNTGNILQGYEQLPEGGDYLLITKSYKDVGALWGFDIPSVAPMSETTIMSPEQFEDLNNRFFNIYTLFDRDRAGMIASQIYRKTYGTTPLLFESTNRLFRTQGEPKDFTDNYSTYGLNYMVDFVNEVKEQLL